MHPLQWSLTCDLLRRPQPSSCFQDPGLVAVHQEEGVVVAEGLRILPAWPPLTVLLQEAGDHRERCPGTVTTFQPQSEDPKSCWVTSTCKVLASSIQGHNYCKPHCYLLMVTVLALLCI